MEGESLFLLSKIYTSRLKKNAACDELKFIIEAGGKVIIPDVTAPRSAFATAEEAARTALDAEVRTTEQIYALVTLASGERNYIAVNFLQWFVSEQLEEIASAVSASR